MVILFENELFNIPDVKVRSTGILVDECVNLTIGTFALGID